MWKKREMILVDNNHLVCINISGPSHVYDIWFAPGSFLKTGSVLCEML